jgi:hypothetical protein
MLVDFKQHSIGDLHGALSAYRATPEDIARQCIAVHDRTEATAKAWVAFDGAQLLAAARATATRLASGELLRPLEAVPVGVKDIFNTADFATQMGSPLWAGFTPGNDARAVFNLKRALFELQMPLEGGGAMTVLHTHLSAFSHGDGTLEAQVAALLECGAAATTAGQPWLLAGDMNALPPGDYELLLEFDGTAPIRERVRITAGETTRVDVRLP